MKIIQIHQFNSYFNYRIGQALKQARLAVPLSRQKVSNATGIPVSMIVQYEQDSILPSDYRFDAMLRLYGITADKLLRSVTIPNWNDIMGREDTPFGEYTHDDYVIDEEAN